MVDELLEIEKMRKYAQENNIPIMQEDGINFLTDFIKKNSINKVLEIGTAIGYSAIMMALANPKLEVVSIERDEERYQEALKNIKMFSLEDRVTLHFKDAFDFTTDDKYDLIFLDAAKAQNINFFEKFSPNLKDNGYIITDNLKFHGLVEMDEDKIESRNVRALVRKIKKYVNYLQDNEEFSTEFYEVGDGISISRRKD